jgi:hypothetical protein
MFNKLLLFFVVFVLIYATSTKAFCFNDLEPKCIIDMQDKMYNFDPVNLVKILIRLDKKKEIKYEVKYRQRIYNQEEVLTEEVIEIGGFKTDNILRKNINEEKNIIVEYDYRP